MSPKSTSRLIRQTPIAISLSLALALSSVPLSALAVEVQNCGDGGPGSGSLRDAITSAAEGETIDMSQLPTKCGLADSVITLSNGEIGIAQDNLTLQGPSVGSVTIEPAAGGQFRVLHHTGSGLLAINDLSVANGNVQAGANLAVGGCVLSEGSLFLTRSSVKDCSANGAHAYGGGAYVLGSAVLLDSTMSGNKALGSTWGRAGGLFAYQGLTMLDSTLSGNDTSGSGGGAVTGAMSSGAYISSSTLEGNSSAQCAAAALSTVSGDTILNSTISGNSAALYDGGLCLKGTDYVANSTIAFNAAAAISGGLAVSTGSNLTLLSTIVANNGANVPDAYIAGGSMVQGADNLIMSSSGVPASVIALTADPKLDPQLRYNGGRTRTHALLSASPAIGAGNNYANLPTDQRGPGYPRVTGPSSSTDIGAFEFDTIFADAFEP